MKRSLEVLALLALFPATACYSYRTIHLEDVRPDLAIRLRVTPEATGHVARVLGYLTQDVEGTFVSLRQDTILLTVATPTAPESRTIQLLYQRLDIPVSQVIEVQERTLDRGRTYACVAAGVAGAAGVAVWHRGNAAAGRQPAGAGPAAPSAGSPPPGALTPPSPRSTFARSPSG
jgi:hypothetical protein